METTVIAAVDVSPELRDKVISCCIINSGTEEAITLVQNETGCGILHAAVIVDRILYDY